MKTAGDVNAIAATVMSKLEEQLILEKGRLSSEIKLWCLIVVAVI